MPRNRPLVAPVRSGFSERSRPTGDAPGAPRGAHAAAAAATHGASRPEKPTVVETVSTAAAGVAVGSAALWFLAPICFTC